MTVLQVVPELQTGGAERTTVDIAAALVAEGDRALVVSAGGRLVPELLAVGGEHVTMPARTKSPYGLWRNARRLADLMEREAVDIVHARSRAPAWSAYLAARRCGVPFVTTYHGTYNEDLPFKRFYNAVMAKGRPVIAVSEFIGRLVAERHRVREEDIVVIPRGADISVFSEDAVSAERTVALAERWGILDDPRPVILLPARLTRWKGHEGLIEAAALLRRSRGEDFLILLVGDGGEDWYARALENRIKSHKLEQQVWLTGGCSDMAAAYKVASVVVSASTDPEAFGRVVVEAQAMGRPVIATDHGGARETVVHGETGWLYPPGDVLRLAETLEAALKLDPSERAHMGLAARARVHARYTVKAMQRATIDVYERAAGRSFGVSL